MFLFQTVPDIYEGLSSSYGIGDFGGIFFFHFGAILFRNF